MNYSLILIFFLVSLKGESQINNCDSIQWSKIDKLKWADFKGTIDTTSEFGATSYISLKYSLRQLNDTIIIKVNCRFVQCNSWTKYRSNKDLTLPHEQTHFDIAEYFKRLFIKRLLERKFIHSDISKSVKDLYSKILLERKLLDKAYDEATDFHRNSKQQVIWSKKILKMVDLLNSYDKSVVTIVMSK